MKSRVALILLLAAACSLGSSDAQAQYGYGGACGYGGFGGCGVYDLGNLYRVLADNVPYYAAFPPVYYSVPVPRTYGYSPFAYPPGVMTPEVVQNVEPLEVINPHVQPTSNPTEEKSDDKLTQATDTSTPLLVMNPYVSTQVADASVQLGR